MIVVIIICSCVVLCLYIIAKSKCSSLDCCGLHVIRDVQAEVEVEESLNTSVPLLDCLINRNE